VPWKVVTLSIEVVVVVVVVVIRLISNDDHCKLLIILYFCVKKTAPRVKWSSEECDIIQRELHNYISAKKLPPRAVIRKLIEGHSALAHRSEQQIVSHIQYRYIGRK